MDEKPYKFHNEVKFECASLVAGWLEDAGEMGSGVIGYLKDHLKCRLLAEIEPVGFFPLNGVSIEADVAQFPKSRLYFCAEKELLLFESNSPHSEWYKFLNTVIDMVQFHCRLSEIYTLGGMISLGVHTATRQLMAVASNPNMKTILSRFGVDFTMNYETPNGQRPTLNSYLIWVARQRNILGASVWVPIPFYLTSVADPQSWRKVLDFFDKRFSLSLDFEDLDQEITKQNERLDRARRNTTELDEFLKRLEANETLNQEENDKLIKDVEEILKENEGKG